MIGSSSNKILSNGYRDDRGAQGDKWMLVGSVGTDISTVLECTMQQTCKVVLLVRNDMCSCQQNPSEILQIRFLIYK